MNRGQVMTLLIGVRHRRTRALDEAVREALRQEDLAREASQTAKQKLVAAAASEARARDSLRALTDPGRTFGVELMLLREHLVSVEKDKLIRQQGEVEQCDAALLLRRGELGARRADRTRNQRKIETLEDGLRLWKDEREQAQDDAQDEDAEESATARLATPVQDGDPSATQDAT